MTSLVIGKQSSGKSLFAEDLACQSRFGRRYYIATMEAVDDDGSNRIKKHRKQRAGKGFITLEIPVDVQDASDLMDHPEECVVLLECAANLTANILFGQHRCDTVSQVRSRIMQLAETVGELIIVTSTYDPEPGDDEETKSYKKVLNEVNITLAEAADRVYDMKDTKGDECARW